MTTSCDVCTKEFYQERGWRVSRTTKRGTEFGAACSEVCLQDVLVHLSRPDFGRSPEPPSTTQAKGGDL